MAITVPLGERAKYVYLLQLCREQIRIVREGEMSALDRIVRAKQTLIESLVDPQFQMKSDPSIVKVIAQIKEAEIESQVVLESRIATVKTKLAELNQFRGAKRAYRHAAPAARRMSFTVDQYTPRFIDRAS